MRLLKLLDEHAFIFTEFTGSSLPPYAILSHTWGIGDEEVTYQDIKSGVGRDKVGYSKLTFCAKLVRQDGLEYFWVDTCCIDKSSSAELSEAINSMFKWYRGATQCYVYLSDVPSTADEQLFQDSKWFTRGWTLQELLAPRSVRFFTTEAELIGTKSSLLRPIQSATGIALDALEGRPLDQFSIEARFSWAERRQTTREEDEAYSLLGIFSVFLPQIYGEGRQSAFRRLRKEIKMSLEDLSLQTEMLLAAQGARKRPFEPSSSELDDLSSNSKRSTVTEDSTKRSRWILESLCFPRMEDRRFEVHEAHAGTYQWILEYRPRNHTYADNFLNWLSSDKEPRRIYWIHGKPGSGKSTVMRFLDRNLIRPEYFQPWSKEKPVIKIQYFFWNPGSELQKSVVGLLRAMLYQLLVQRPNLAPHVVPMSMWMSSTPAADFQSVHWTQTELQNTFYSCLVKSKDSITAFVLLDGLDELAGNDEIRIRLVEFLIKLAKLEHVKLCISSRPWNIFRDFFDGYPRLKLENLTRNDISLFVRAQLSGHARFQHLIRNQPEIMDKIVKEITTKACGVFLWVRLVMREVSKALRDGDGMKELRKRLEKIPGDLNDYFKRILSTIESHQQNDASVVLQIALYRECDFATLHPLRLIDLSFIDEEQPDFLLSNPKLLQELDLADSISVKHRLDSILRKLNSRCMGLLECRYNHTPISLDYDISNDETTWQIWDSCGNSLLADTGCLTEIKVDFFHRTCRDFLLTPEIQGMLLGHPCGAYDAQMYLLNARICEFIALANLEGYSSQTTNLASEVISSLARPENSDKAEIGRLAEMVKNIFEELGESEIHGASGLYVEPSLSSWIDEKSSFLTLAIDFGIDAYTRQYLNSERILRKRGRPILDYLLRPRFLGTIEELEIGYQTLNLEFISSALRLGANPNEIYDSASLWALFLTTLADIYIDFPDQKLLSDCAAVLELMIRAGAAPMITSFWLTQDTAHSVYYYFYSSSTSAAPPEQRLQWRWPEAKPVMQTTASGESQRWYAVSDLLEGFRTYLGADVDRLKTLLHDRSKRPLSILL